MKYAFIDGKWKHPMIVFKPNTKLFQMAGGYVKLHDGLPILEIRHPATDEGNLIQVLTHELTHWAMEHEARQRKSYYEIHTSESFNRIGDLNEVVADWCEVVTDDH